MSLKKWWLSIVVVTVGWATTVHGQVNIPSPRFSPKSVQEPSNTRPLAEPGIFDYDGQMFAPVEFSNFDELKPNTGLYASVDRMYTSISRSGARDVLPLGVTSQDVPTGSDYMWGNRYELGVMSEAGAGWGLVYERTNGVALSAGQDYTIATPFLVETTFSNVEINRTFRQALSNGGYFEPYFGLKYLNVSDNTIEDTNITIGTTTAGNRFKQKVSNNAVGGAVGGRYNLNRGRFRYTFDGSMAATYNQQRYFATDLLYSGTTIGVNESYDSDQSFVPAFDGRVEATYLVTRDIGVRTGFQMMYLWDGVARSDNLTTALNSNSINGIGGGTTGVFDESTLAAGFSFGLEWKR